MHVGEFIPNSRGGISFVTSKTRCSSTVGKGKGSQYGNHIGRSLAGASLMTMARQSEGFTSGQNISFPVCEIRPEVDESLKDYETKFERDEQTCFG